MSRFVWVLGAVLLLMMLTGCQDESEDPAPSGGREFGGVLLKGRMEAREQAAMRRPAISDDAPAALASPGLMVDKVVLATDDYFRVQGLELVHDGLSVEISEHRPRADERLYVDACMAPRPGGKLYLRGSDYGNLMDEVRELTEITRGNADVVDVTAGYMLDDLGTVSLSAMEQNPSMDLDRICARMVLEVTRADLQPRS